ncbi:hypothetical protein BDW62DRAFT_197359 [Aspergillus aurantiobrunneus]
MAARMSGNVKLIEDLVRMGADVFSPSRVCFNAVLGAAVYNHEQCLTYLLDHAAAHPNKHHWSRHLDKMDEGRADPISRICLCLKKAEILDQPDHRGRTMLRLAAEARNVALISSLLACGARHDVANMEGRYPVHDAGSTDYTAVVQTRLPQPDTEPNAAVKVEKEFWLNPIAQPVDYPNSYHRLKMILALAILRRNIEMARHPIRYGAAVDTCVPNPMTEGRCYTTLRKRGALIWFPFFSPMAQTWKPQTALAGVPCTLHVSSAAPRLPKH